MGASAPPQAEQELIFRTFLLFGEDFELQLVVLDRLLKATIIGQLFALDIGVNTLVWGEPLNS